MEILINDYDLKDGDIKETKNKVRALLINDKNEVLIAKYGGNYLFPGGKIDNKESKLEALTRELKEETGILYNKDDLEELLTIVYYQKDYPRRKKGKTNVKLNVTYFIGKINSIDLSNQNLTKKEKKSGFSLEYIDIDELLDFLDKKETINLREPFFRKEIDTIINYYMENIKF